ncbi:hypothetical protein HG531_009985 [Fusarium graminearum]|nr:hypothetical protein HG531_009985 [Fusarium graminearum]
MSTADVLAGCGNDKGLHDTLTGKLVTLAIASTEDIVDHVLGLNSGILEFQVSLTLGGIGNRFCHHGLHVGTSLSHALRVAERKALVPAWHGGELLVQFKRLGNSQDHGVRSGIRRGKVLEIHSKDQLSNSLSTELQHIGVHVPGLITLIKFIKDLEGILDSPLHSGCVMSHSLGAESRGEKLVYFLPLFGISVTDKDTSLLVLDGEQRVALDNTLGEEV